MALKIEHIEMDQAGATHHSRFGASSLVQQLGHGRWVVGIDIVARYIPTVFTTKQAAMDAGTALVLAWSHR